MNGQMVFGMIMVAASLIIIKIARKALKLIGFLLMLAGVYIASHPQEMAELFSRLF